MANRGERGSMLDPTTLIMVDDARAGGIDVGDVGIGDVTHPSAAGQAESQNDDAFFKTSELARSWFLFSSCRRNCPVRALRLHLAGDAQQPNSGMVLDVARDPADRLVSGAAITAGIVAVLVLVGWLFDVTALRTIAPVWSAMAPLTPFLLISISIALVCFERHRTWANVAMLFAGVLAGAALLEYLFGVPLGLSALSRGLDVMNAEFQPELPDPETAAATVLLVMTMRCYRTRHRRLHDFADVVVVLIGFVCLQVLLEYAYNVLASESWRGFRRTCERRSSARPQHRRTGCAPRWTASASSSGPSPRPDCGRTAR